MKGVFFIFRRDLQRENFKEPMNHESAAYFQNQVTFLIGHRGVGKTTFLKRLAVSLSNVRCFDLISEVARLADAPIEMILEREGEAGLRTRERQALQFLDESVLSAPGLAPIVIELDAGFEAFDHPVFSRENVGICWIRRRSDFSGRIFPDAPRAQPEKSPLLEFRERASFRARRFARLASEELVLSEGVHDVQPEEDALLRGIQSFPEGSVLLQSTDFQRKGFVRKWTRGASGILMLDAVDAQKVTELGLSADRVLFRCVDRIPPSKDGFRLDVSMDLLTQINSEQLSEVAIVSAFNRAASESIGSIVDRLTAVGATLPQVLLKLECRVESWSEFEAVLQWKQRDPLRHILLPSSPDGRWRWYHLYSIGRQSLSLFKVSLGGDTRETHPDLPLPQEWARAKVRGGEWGTHLSLSPRESAHRILQDRWHRDRGFAFLEVPLQKAEFLRAIQSLSALGVTRISLDSELSLDAFSICEGRVSLRARRSGRVDTLAHGETGWQGDHAATPAFRKVIREWRRRAGVRDPRDPRSIVWVGDENQVAWVREELPQVVPAASVGQPSQYSDKVIALNSASDAELAALQVVRPDLLVCGEVREADSGLGTEFGQPRWVVDLVADEDSPGRRIAQQLGARHFPGDVFLKEITLERQLFWSETPTLIPALLRRAGSR